MPSWVTCADWRVPRSRASWQAADGWHSSFKSAMAAAGQELEHVLAAWDQHLKDVDGDPTRMDWTRFRPLRLSREEDWSDWLAHLLTSADSGRFAARLLADTRDDVEAWRVLDAGREVTTPAGYRADLVLRFAGGRWAHVEVKVGDANLEKTPATTDALRAVETGDLCGEYVLLLPEDVVHWDVVRQQFGKRGDSFGTLTWRDVASAIRAELLESGTPTPWRVWASTFLGAIEQRLLGHAAVGPGDISSGKYRPRSSDVERLRMLSQILKDHA